MKKINRKKNIEQQEDYYNIISEQHEILRVYINGIKYNFPEDNNN